MKTPKRIYLPPSMAVSEVKLESPICGGSVFTPQEKEQITIHKQGFAGESDNWNGDFSDLNNWTPQGSSSNQ